jgi:CubicO group peptidase (beta-lactamase class C family)
MLASLIASACSPDSDPTPIVHSPEISTVSYAQAQRIDHIADAWIASGKTVAVAVEVSRGGQVVFARGFGRANLDSAAPATPGTVFRIGSITKQFTAAAILQLVQAGKITLNDKLSLYYPGFPRGDEVTIRELLNHISGIHNYTEFGLNPLALLQMRKDHTTEEWVQYIADQKPLYDFAPGSAWHYTNSGFFLLGGIVEKVSGEPLSRYLHDHIFLPLGMSQTAVDGNSDIGPERARGYEHAWLPGGGFQTAMSISMTVPGGAGALRSSADDLIKWSNSLFAGKAVDQSLLSAMLTPARLADGRLASLNRLNMDPSELAGDYGFGIEIGAFEGHREIGHEGDIPGFNAALDTYPDDDLLTVVILANTPGGAPKLEKQVAQIMLDRS